MAEDKIWDVYFEKDGEQQHFGIQALNKREATKGARALLPSKGWKVTKINEVAPYRAA